ncbi:PhaM family polyhydroxyalkanoate granule multifunctional regulatory protein [Paracidovorax wautersii]|uniref:Uncharacterized protein n=1 Tax=Paracidovorax wautersii TaxID=1177982 RepID=A0A1I2H1N5_9BURK|nr:PhaM family polyhydroxyalkanoate granule multifunctional regulatory protein [Paracidovorax wautersii]SFF24184.1 hypothetical protein SAMN04489711_11914 [Paracidovorax wautersii]
MSDNTPFGFGRFVPGFDFLQNLAKNSAAGMPAMPSMPGMPSWVAPTVSEEELEKRIEELKAVQFWLDQNSRALTATVQALEVQKMTLATLKGMNVAMGDLASAFTPKPAAAADAPAPRPAAAPAPAPAQHAPHRAAEDAAGPDADEQADAAAGADQPAGVVDPMQWWTALGTQFQQIAANALKDVAQHQGAFDATRDMAAEAVKSATDMASHLAAQGLQGVQEATRRAASAAPAADASKSSTKRRAPAKKAGKGTAAKAPAKKAPAKAATPSTARKPAPAPAPARTASGRSRTAR